MNGLADVTGGALQTAGHVTMYGVVIFRCSACSYVVLAATHGVGIDVSQGRAGRRRRPGRAAGGA